MNEVEIENKNEGDLMIKYLFIIFSHINGNKIRKLKLINNNIKDPSILNRIQFNFL